MTSLERSHQVHSTRWVPKVPSGGGDKSVLHNVRVAEIEKLKLAHLPDGFCQKRVARVFRVPYFFNVPLTLARQWPL